MTASQRGFKLGQSVVDSRAADNLFKLVALDPSNVSLRSIDPTTGSYNDHKIIALDYTEFLGHYSIKQQVEMLEGYPANTIFGSAALRSSWAAADCVSFMRTLVEKHAEPTVNVRMRPGRGVFAGAAYKAKAMTIVPACLQITPVADDKGLNGSPFFMKFGHQLFAMPPPAGASKVKSVAFFIRSSDDPETANCSIKKARSESDEYPSIIECTIIVNHKKVDLGHELVIYREKAVVAKKAKSVAVTLGGAETAVRPTKQPNFRR